MYISPQLRLTRNVMKYDILSVHPKKKQKMTPVRYVYCLHSGLYDTATRNQTSGSAVAVKPRDAPRQLKKCEISFRLQNYI